MCHSASTHNVGVVFDIVLKDAPLELNKTDAVVKRESV